MCTPRLPYTYKLYTLYILNTICMMNDDIGKATHRVSNSWHKKYFNTSDVN